MQIIKQSLSNTTLYAPFEQEDNVRVYIDNKERPLMEAN